MTPIERLNALSARLDIPYRLNQDSGQLAREELLVTILEKLSERRATLQLPRKHDR